MAPAAERRPLLFVNQYYHPDVAATGQLLADLSEYLSEQGYAVEVLTARGDYRSGRLGAAASEVRRGVLIRRYRTPGAGRRSHLGRVSDYLAFTVQVAGRLLFGPKPDAIVVLTTPPLLPALAALVKRVRGVPYAVWSMDLHPEAEVAAGMIRSDGALDRTLRAIADDAYRGANFVVVLGECMRRLVLAKGVAEDRITDVPVWTRREDVEPIYRSANPLATELGVQRDDFVVMYSGNAGLAHTFGPFLEAAGQLEAEPGSRFLFVGNGPRRPEIESFALDNHLTGFNYLDYFPRDRLSESLSLGDAHIVSLRPEFEGIAVPAKLYGIMAAARPVLFLGPGACETARTVEEVGCGAVVDPDHYADPSSRVAEILRSWRTDPELRRQLGTRGREAFLERFERVPCCVSFERELRLRLSA